MTTEEVLKVLVEVEADLSCESCGADIQGTREDSICRGCGIVVCLSCVCVFQHYEFEPHGKGNPLEEVRRLRSALKVTRGTEGMGEGE